MPAADEVLMEGTNTRNLQSERLQRAEHGGLWVVEGTTTCARDHETLSPFGTRFITILATSSRAFTETRSPFLHMPTIRYVIGGVGVKFLRTAGSGPRADELMKCAAEAGGKARKNDWRRIRGGILSRPRRQQLEFRL